MWFSFMKGMIADISRVDLSKVSLEPMACKVRYKCMNLRMLF